MNLVKATKKEKACALSHLLQCKIVVYKCALWGHPAHFSLYEKGEYVDFWYCDQSEGKPRENFANLYNVYKYRLSDRYNKPPKFKPLSHSEKKRWSNIYLECGGNMRKVITKLGISKTAVYKKLKQNGGYTRLVWDKQERYY